MDTVEVTSKANSLSIETFNARFDALKIFAENDCEAMQEKCMFQLSLFFRNALKL